MRVQRTESVFYIESSLHQSSSVNDESWQWKWNVRNEQHQLAREFLADLESFLLEVFLLQIGIFIMNRSHFIAHHAAFSPWLRYFSVNGLFREDQEIPPKFSTRLENWIYHFAWLRDRNGYLERSNDKWWDRWLILRIQWPYSQRCVILDKFQERRWKTVPWISISIFLETVMPGSTHYVSR